MMEKQKIITIVAILVISGVVGFSFLNIYTLEKLDLSGIDDVFRFYETSTGGKFRVCNNSLIPASFNQFNVVVFYEDKVLGTLVVDGSSIMSNSILDVYGNYISDSYAQSQTLFMHFDHMFSNDSTIRIDPRKLAVETEFQTTIVGFPYSVTEQYSGMEFWHMLNDKNNPKC